MFSGSKETSMNRKVYISWVLQHINDHRRRVNKPQLSNFIFDKPKRLCWLFNHGSDD